MKGRSPFKLPRCGKGTMPLKRYPELVSKGIILLFLVLYLFPRAGVLLKHRVFISICFGEEIVYELSRRFGVCCPRVVTSRELKRGEAPLKEKPFPPLLIKERGIKGERSLNNLKRKSPPNFGGLFYPV